MAECFTSTKCQNFSFRGQAQKCDGVKPVNPPLLITGSLTSIHQYIYKCPHAHSNRDLFHGRFIKLCKLLFDIW
jgi:hypothetical protein